MKRTARVISMLALAATILPSFLFFTDILSLSATKAWMLIATAVWYLSTPLWMQVKPTERATTTTAASGR